MLSFSGPGVENRNLVRDLIGILLALAFGISGQLILSEPVKILAPRLPMLSPQDWPGSELGRALSITGGRPWRENRSFTQSIMLIKNGISIAEATQRIIWHADRMQAAAMWNQYKNEPYYDFIVIASSTNNDKPESVLLCSTPAPDTYRECLYRAYWEHWYTDVTFTLGISDDVPLSEVQKLTDRLDQLLMSAPDTPCQGVFCTNEMENESQ